MAKARILIVEDEAIVAKDIKKTLESWGYDVAATVPTGEAAIAKAEELKPDLILMDIMLRGAMNGIEAARKINEKNDVAIVYLTAFTEDKKLQEAKITDAFGYVVKPFEEKQLRGVIEMALYKHEMEKKLKEQKRKYEALYHNSPDGYLSTDASNAITEANDTFLKITGYSREEVISSSAEKFLESGEKTQNILRDETGFQNAELSLKRKGNGDISVLANASPVLEDGKYAGSRINIRDISNLKKLEKEKTHLAQEVIKLTRKIPLTDNEKLVFYTLIRHPLLNDIELSRKLKLKRSTVTAIRNRLAKEKFYFTYRIPNFQMIGCELATVTYASINPLHADDSEKAKLLRKLSSIPEIVCSCATTTHLTAIGVSKNITDIKRHLDTLLAEFRKTGLARNFTSAYFPLEISTMDRMLDCSAYLKSLFELDLKEERPEKTDLPAHAKIKLTENEKTILYALVKFPSHNDSEISKMTKLPRPSISQARKRLLEDGLFSVANIPNFLKIGLELLVLEHTRLEPDALQETSNNISRHLKESKHCYCSLRGDSEMCTLNLYGDYTEYEKARNESARFYNDNRLKTLAANIHPFLEMQNAVVQFAPLVKKILEIKAKF